MEFKFIPLQQFEWVREYEDGSTQLIGVYYPGQVYNCTKEPRHDALREQCKRWEEDELIQIIPLMNGQKFKTVKG